jgi:hypothetical protein
MLFLSQTVLQKAGITAVIQERTIKDQLSIDYCENKLAMVFTGTSF